MFCCDREAKTPHVQNKKGGKRNKGKGEKAKDQAVKRRKEWRTEKRH